MSLGLAACGGDSGAGSADADNDGEISLNEAAAEVDRNQGMIRPQAGLYRGTMELVDLQVPDAPPEAQQMLKAMIGGEPRTHEFCLTEEDAEQGFEKMAKESQGGDCSFERFDIQSGRMDAVMNCQVPGQGAAKITLQGTGTRTSSDMTMNMDASGPNGETMKMTMKTSQQRVGDCPG
ncbi:DUF3617 domain-containing protein [Erythrobacter sp. JK5]|uniref:DUF3617 domain-containing protein n=1 Tax=Erythrobacter sp. JK5 TaxID=2829500 RepID=UPI001BADC069|nr:DUF3617 domain-containing protein [Erythrobacter sp. JK5]QUL38205.1 DUF3617 domain-containing protein [Erythrobacter sp. JK5]